MDSKKLPTGESILIYVAIQYSGRMYPYEDNVVLGRNTTKVKGRHFGYRHLGCRHLGLVKINYLMVIQLNPLNLLDPKT